MSILKLKSIAHRGTILSAVFAIVMALIAPASLTFADALNPLTNRSLTLSSSSPGWDYKDGSGNITYAQPNSGANGQKTGNTFSFNVSSDSTSAPIKAFTFQYCTASAGSCLAPGNNGYNGTAGSYTSRKADSATTSDLNVATSTPTEVSSGKFSALIDPTTGDPIRNNTTSTIPKADDSEGNFAIMKNVAGTWTYSPGWSMKAVNKEDGSIAVGTSTGAKNFIELTNTSGETLGIGQAVKIIFFGTNGNYITNPGIGAFFVKINDYNALTGSDPDYTSLVDGGVTVANVMNQSIELQTKVLETMDFSVGTVDPYTLNDTQLAASSLGVNTHGQCDPILPGMTTATGAANANTLQLGDQLAENSLSTAKTYSTHSYWRLSSNSSAGATVYYSGVTLKNTVGDQIAPIGVNAQAPSRGTPQFGLALANGKIADNSTGPYAVNYNTEETAGKVFENGADNGATQGVDGSVATDVAAKALAGYHAPKLYPLVPQAQYDQGAGIVNGGLDYGVSTNDPTTTRFAFDPTSNTIPAPIASESASVVDCVTAKVRYIANIAATTPAGIYTTKINYIAAPQY